VDGVRGALLGINTYPFLMNLGIVTVFAAAMLVLGSILFSRMK
jgi:ABC-2 type transport system permease protein